MKQGQAVMAWDADDIKRTKGVYSHQGSTKHWVNVKGKLTAFDHVAEPPAQRVRKSVTMTASEMRKFIESHHNLQITIQP